MRSLGCGCALFLPSLLLGALWLSARGTDPHGGGFIAMGAFFAFALAVVALLIMVMVQEAAEKRRLQAARPDAVQGGDKPEA